MLSFGSLMLLVASPSLISLSVDLLSRSLMSSTRQTSVRYAEDDPFLSLPFRVGSSFCDF